MANRLSYGLKVLLCALLLSGTAHAQLFTRFGPVNGILKGSTTTPQTSAAVASDVYGLFSGCSGSSTALFSDGTCKSVIAGTVPNGVLKGASGAFAVANATDVENVVAPALPCIDAVTAFGLVGNGSTDNTAAFTTMFSTAGQTLCIKTPGTYVTGKFTIPANTYLYLAPGVVIKDSGVLGTNDRLITISSTNVVISGVGAEITMARFYPSTSDQRVCVFIAGATDVAIYGLETQGCGGDGFYIGLASANVRLEGVDAEDNNRNGLSITGGTNIIVENSQFNNSNGTAPQAGIDIEPNTNTDVLNGIYLRNIVTENNVVYGIESYLNALNANNYIDIEIDRAYDSGSQYSYFFENSLSGTTGRFIVNNVYSNAASAQGITVQNWSASGAPMTINAPIVYNPGTIGIYLYCPSGSTVTPVFGNITLIHPYVVDAQSPHVMTYAIFTSNSETGGTTSNFNIIDPIQLSGYTTQALGLSSGMTSCFVSDTLNMTQHPTACGNGSMFPTGIIANTASTWASRLQAGAGKAAGLEINSNGSAQGAAGEIDLFGNSAGTDATLRTIGNTTLHFQVNSSDLLTLTNQHVVVDTPSTSPGLEITAPAATATGLVLAQTGQTVWEIYNAASTNNLFFNGGGTSWMSIASDGGVQVGNPTGGDKGAGTVNVAGNFYVNGVAVSSGTQVYSAVIAVSGTCVVFTQQPAGWISNCTHSTGLTTLTYSGGFTSSPACFLTLLSGTSTMIKFSSNPTTTSAQVETFIVDTSGSTVVQDNNYQISCVSQG